MKFIQKWLARLADEHPFALAWGVILFAVALVERLDDLASWKEKFDWILARETHRDPATHHLVSSPWLFFVIFALILTWVIWLMLFAMANFQRQKTVKAKNERQTTAYKTLQGMMGAASLIRNRQNPPQSTPQKSVVTVHMVYLISKDYTTAVTREYEVAAVNETIHYWNLSNQPSEYADEIEYLDDINFKVREGSGAGEIAYLPTRNDPRDKRATVYFLPRLEAGSPARKIVLSFIWPRYMKKLGVTGEEEISFTLTSVNVIQRIEVEVYLQPGTGRKLDPKVTGPDYGGRVETRSHAPLGWNGFAYLIEKAPAGTHKYAITARLVDA